MILYVSHVCRDFVPTNPIRGLRPLETPQFLTSFEIMGGGMKGLNDGMTKIVFIVYFVRLLLHLGGVAP